jgi:hypothetical protein
MRVGSQRATHKVSRLLIDPSLVTSSDVNEPLESLRFKVDDDGLGSHIGAPPFGGVIPPSGRRHAENYKESESRYTFDSLLIQWRQFLGLCPAAQGSEIVADTPPYLGG